MTNTRGELVHFRVLTLDDVPRVSDHRGELLDRLLRGLLLQFQVTFFQLRGHSRGIFYPNSILICQEACVRVLHIVGPVRSTARFFLPVPVDDLPRLVKSLLDLDKVVHPRLVAKVLDVDARLPRKVFFHLRRHVFHLHAPITPQETLPLERPQRSLDECDAHNLLAEVCYLGLEEEELAVLSELDGLLLNSSPDNEDGDE